MSVLAGAIAGAGAIGKVEAGRLHHLQQLSDKHLALFLMMNQWVKVKQEGKSLTSYFEKNGYKKIAVYGMSYAGETYGIDQRADSIYADVNIVSVEGELELVDAVVVTAITFFDEIEEKLSEKVNCPIISLEDILYEV